MLESKNDTFGQNASETIAANTADPAKQFTLRYVIALLLTACLFVLSYFFLDLILNRQSNYNAQTNLISSQNKNIQQISKTVLMLEKCQKDSYCQSLVKSLDNLQNYYRQQQSQLLSNDSLLQKEEASSKTSKLIQNNQAAYEPIMESCQQIVQIKRDLLSAEPSNERLLQNKLHIYIQKVLYKEAEYTQTLAALSKQYNAQAQKHLKKMRTRQVMLLSLAFIALLLQALLIFQPIVRKIKRYLHEAQEANDAAQAKSQEMEAAYREMKQIQERTQRDAEELSRTNQELMQAQDEINRTNEALKRKTEELAETHDIIKLNQQLEATRFMDAAMAHFSEIMRWGTEENIYDWSESLLKELTPYIGGLQAILYAYDEEKHSLFATAGYAISIDEYIEKSEVAMGENLVGQVAKSRKPIYIKSLNGQAAAYTTNSGTELIEPSTLIVQPLVFNENIAGVLEMSSTIPLEQRHLELLDRLSEAIASNLSTLQDQKRINQLFADSQMAQKRLRRTFKKIKDNEERFRKLAEVTQEGLLFVNQDIIRDTNSVVLRMLGIDESQELVGKYYTDVIAPKYRVELSGQNLLQDGRTYETVALRKDGVTFPVEIQSRQVNFEGESIHVISLRDITEKKKTEQELAEANRIASLVSELEKKNKDITSSIEYAQRIQEAILPSDKLMGKGFMEHFVLYIPKDIVSGDFYWFAEKNEHAFIAAVDCTGHGVPGAFMSIIGYSNLNKIVIEQGLTSPAEILTTLDSEVTHVLKQRDGESRSRDGMDLALCALNIYEKKLSFAGAYRPLYLIRNNELIQYKGNSYPIGGSFKFKKKKEFTEHELQLKEGDTLYIFSDGYPDQFGGPENRKYMTKRFKNLLLSIQEHPLEEQKNILRYELEQWRGDYKQMDDILVIGLRF